MSTPEKRIGRYVILKTLPPGGMAEVFVARRDGLEGPCVLKRMRVGIGENKVITHRFIREAQVASRLFHPHIARVFEASVEDGALCMAVELVRGHDLAAIMYELSGRKVRVPMGIGVGIVLRVLKGLDYAHTFRDEAGQHLEIVHRDAGPRNVMIGYEGEVKIIDFGLAKAGFGQMLTASGVLLGTPRYMAPEQARGEVVDARADVYAAGVTLFELLTGRALVKDVEPMDALQTVLRMTPPRLSDVEPKAPRELTPVLARALEKDRRERYATARAFEQDLLRAAASRVEIATDREIAAFMKQHFPDRDRAISELGAMAKEIAQDMPSIGSDAETVVYDPEAPTEEKIAAHHESIDLSIPKPRARVRRAPRTSAFWKAAAYVLAFVAIVMVGIVAYRFAAG